MVVAGFVLVFGLVMTAEYVAFRRGLEALAELPIAGAPLTLYVLETLLILVLVISLVSFVASGLWIYYRAADTRFLLAAPFPLRGLYALRTVETFLLTSWAQAVVGLPALLALGAAYHRPLAFYATGAAILAAFAALVAGLGALLTTGAGAAFRRLPTRVAVGLAVLTLVATFAVVVGRNVIPSTGDFYAIFEPGILNGKPASIKFIEAKFALWPSHPFAAALYTAATRGKAGSRTTHALLALAPVLALLGAATLGRRLYARALPAIAESFVLTAGPATTARPRAFPRRFRGPVGALLERDLLTLARNPHEWSRAAFLGFLLALYTSFVFVAPLREVANRPDAVARLLLLNVLASGYFLTAFGLRFVFPSLSLEGRAAWVLFSSPVRLRRLILAKLSLYAALLAVVVLPIALAGTLRLVRDPALLLTTGALLGLVVASTATLLLAFGAAWPDFREQNPEVLSTSGSGLAATVLCLVYVAAIAWMARRAALPGADVLSWVTAAGTLSAALGAVALALVARRLPTLEAP